MDVSTVMATAAFITKGQAIYLANERWGDKMSVRYRHNSVVLSLKKEGNVDLCHGIHDARKHLSQRESHFRFHLYEVPRLSNSKSWEATR